MIYFTSDTHYGHANVIDFCNRPFKNVDRMDNALVRNYNEIINDDDIVYFIGDFTIKGSQHKGYIENVIKKLKGNKYLIIGNHDKLKPFDYVDMGFHSVHTSLIIDTTLGKLFLNHDPCIYCYIDNILNIPLICGHMHTLFRSIGSVINVGVDVWDYRPVSLYQIENELIKNTNIKDSDTKKFLKKAEEGRNKNIKH